MTWLALETEIELMFQTMSVPEVADLTVYGCSVLVCRAEGQRLRYRLDGAYRERKKDLERRRRATLKVNDPVGYRAFRDARNVVARKIRKLSGGRVLAGPEERGRRTLASLRRRYETDPEYREHKKRLARERRRRRR